MINRGNDYAHNQPMLRYTDSDVFDDKHGPHFHANYAEFKAQVSIADGSVLSGALPTRANKLVQEWCRLHRRELIENWERARRGESLVEIKGLE